jgi:hypothetical protein
MCKLIFFFGGLIAQAAVAFFECLGLHAKGVIRVKQTDPYGEITLESTPALATFKVTV